MSVAAPGIIASSLWRSLLPHGIVAYETQEFVQAPFLFDAERQIVERAVPKRIAEFAAGRLCARQALADLGHDRFALLREADRRPRWPEDIVGSITHTDTYCGVAAARRSTVSGLGIDAEIIGRVQDEMLRHICTPAERASLMAMDNASREERATLVFSAREAFYKCHASAGGGMLDFQDVELQIAEGTFVVEPQTAFAQSWAPATVLTGRYTIMDGTVFCAMAFPP